MMQNRKKWFVTAICIIAVLALGTGGLIYYKKQEQQNKLPPSEYIQKLEKQTLDEEVKTICDRKADWKDRSSEGLGLTTQIILGDAWKALLQQSGLQMITVQSDIQMDKDMVTGQGAVSLNGNKALRFNVFHDGTQKRDVGESGGVSCLQILELKEDYLMLETELTEALFVPSGTELSFESEMRKWLGMFWQKGQTVTKRDGKVTPKGISDACTEYDIVYHTGEFMTNKYSMVWKKMKLYVDQSDVIRGRVIDLMVDNVDYSVTIVRNDTKKEYRQDVSFKKADSSVTYTFKISLTKDRKYPTLKIDVLAGKDRLFLAELSQNALSTDQQQSLKQLHKTGEETIAAAQKNREKSTNGDDAEKFYWLYGNKKNTDGMTLTHYLYGVDVPAFLEKIKENCGVDLTKLAQKFDHY
ncbi:MAG: hypothetical protein MR316_01105 [Lachnospiraceae bacterium]|nr:hypothetical protein [Lachnospiraceae bacterium]